jgi:hypothetical protein
VRRGGETGTTYHTGTVNAVILGPVFPFLPLHPFVICTSCLPQALLQFVYLKEEGKGRKVGTEIGSNKDILYSISTLLEGNRNFKANIISVNIS